MNFHIHITLHPQQPIINVNANPVFNNNGPNNNYIPANPMGFYAQQHGTTMPPMRMQRADYAHSYNDYYTQQTHMTSSGNYKEQMGSISKKFLSLYPTFTIDKDVKRQLYWLAANGHVYEEFNNGICNESHDEDNLI
ncbi:unnamed protein product, partial [Rotaria socialis]